jgi:hypothetical protein
MLLLTAGSISAAMADTVIDLTAPSTLPSSVTYIAGSSAVAGNPLSTTGGVTTYTLSSPGTYNYGQSFGPLSLFTSGSKQYAFYTDYVFTVAPSAFDSLSSSINLGTTEAVNGLQARLYDYSVGSTQNLTLPAFSPSGPVSDAWSTASNLAPGLTGSTSVITPTTLGAGTYVLEIRASSVGTAGGSYSGVVNLTPVPLPAALPLLFSGLGLFGAFRRKQSAA